MSIEKKYIAIGIVWLFQLSGIIGILLGYKDWFLEKTPLTLFLHFSLLAWLYPLVSTRGLGVSVLLIVLMGFTAEWIGINLLPIFGDYYYGKNFGVQLDGTPLLIGLNWCVLSLISASIAQKFLDKSWQQVLLAASLMVFLDIPMEYVASNFGYWHFKGGMPPIENYISWFIVGLLMQLLLTRFDLKANFLFAMNLFLANLLFFTLFALI